MRVLSIPLCLPMLGTAQAATPGQAAIARQDLDFAIATIRTYPAGYIDGQPSVTC